MSLKTWKKEFYPKKPSKKMTAREAVEHSLKKWTGLLAHNMEKHGIVISVFGVDDPGKDILDAFLIDSSTCALCVKYLDYEATSHKQSCEKCPLSQTLGKPCDSGARSPYARWTEKGNAVSMVRALMDTLETIDSFVETR